MHADFVQKQIVNSTSIQHSPFWKKHTIRLMKCFRQTCNTGWQRPIQDIDWSSRSSFHVGGISFIQNIPCSGADPKSSQIQNREGPTLQSAPQTLPENLKTWNKPTSLCLCFRGGFPDPRESQCMPLPIVFPQHNRMIFWSWWPVIENKTSCPSIRQQKIQLGKDTYIIDKFYCQSSLHAKGNLNNVCLHQANKADQFHQCIKARKRNSSPLDQCETSYVPRGAISFWNWHQTVISQTFVLNWFFQCLDRNALWYISVICG